MQKEIEEILEKGLQDIYQVHSIVVWEDKKDEENIQIQNKIVGVTWDGWNKGGIKENLQKLDIILNEIGLTLDSTSRRWLDRSTGIWRYGSGEYYSDRVLMYWIKIVKKQ